MNVMCGNTRLISDVVRWYFGRILLLYITVPLLALWVIIGLVLDPPSAWITGISIPVYVHVVFFALSGFRPLFPIAVGMGSTRTQFLRSYYFTGLGTVFATMLLLNVCQYVLRAFYERWLGWSNIMHPAVLYLSEYRFRSYFAIDLMLGLFLFGFAFLVYCIWHRLGTTYSVMLLMGAALPILFLYYGGVMDPWFAWLCSLNLSTVAVFTLFGSVGLAALLSTYPLMRNASLHPRLARN